MHEESVDVREEVLIKDRGVFRPIYRTGSQMVSQLLMIVVHNAPDSDIHVAEADSDEPTKPLHLRFIDFASLIRRGAKLVLKPRLCQIQFNVTP
jgi:hypothetical protein